ncbi:MAG: TolC family protein [Bacteroidales bacterium]|jgi:outer membrane protein TolC|nr:TolC family protein [Bacteroidales bacterium]
MSLFRIKSLQKIAMLGFAFFAVIQVTYAQELLTLDRALQYSETESPIIIQSKLNIERVQKNLEAQRAALKSRFSLEANPLSFNRNRSFDDVRSTWYTSENLSSNTNLRISQPILFTDGTISLNNEFGWQKSKSSATNAIPQNERFYNNLYLNLNQPLFTYNRLKMQLKQLELNYENAKISYALQRLNMERNVTQQFYNVFMLQENLSIAKAELENTQVNYELIKNKADAGLVAMEELYQAELNLMQSQSTVEERTVSYENAKDQLKLLLGMDIYSDFVILNIDISTQESVSVNLEQAIENGLKNRMELRQREIDIENSQFAMIQTKAQNEFSGDLNLRLGITGDDTNLAQIYKKENTVNNPSVSISFNLPIFDWGEKKARIAAQEAAIESVQIDYEEEQKDIILSIREVYRSIQSQWNQIQIAKQKQNNAQLTYEINNERYLNGDLTGMDLNLQQQQLSNARISYTQAQINYKIALLNLKIQSLYDFEMNLPVLPDELYLSTEN